MDDRTPIGAAWFRSWTVENHAFGFVDADTPEIAIALDRGHRERGIGTTLLKALLELARSQNAARLSLAVEKENLRALHVYEKAGFKRVASTADDYTMVVDL